MLIKAVSLNPGKIPEKIYPPRKLKLPEPPLLEPQDRVEAAPRREKPAFTSKPATPSSPVKKWTVLFYLQGDNDLSLMEAEAFRRIKSVGSDENVNLAAMLALKGQPVKRGLLKPDPAPYPTAETQIFPEGETLPPGTDLGDAKTLEQFLEWGAENYPAEHYAVVLSDHGQGILGSMTGGKSGKMINNRELGEVLNQFARQTGQNRTLLNLDSGLMGQAEVAYQLKEGAGYLVASQDLQNTLPLPLPGLMGAVPQDKVMQDLKAGIKERGDISEAELAELYVFESHHQFGAEVYTPTNSALDLKRIETVKADADRLAQALVAGLEEDPRLLHEITKEIKRTQHFLALEIYDEPHSQYLDLDDFARRLLQNRKLNSRPDIKEAARALSSSVEATVIAEQHAKKSIGGKELKDSHGLSVYLTDQHNRAFHYPGRPFHSDSPGFDYEKLAFAEQSQWLDLLDKISAEKAAQGKWGPEKLLGLILNKANDEIMDWQDKIDHSARMVKNRDYRQAGDGIKKLLGHKIAKPVDKTTALPSQAVSGLAKAYKGSRKIHQGLTGDYPEPLRFQICSRGALDLLGGISELGSFKSVARGVMTKNLASLLAVLALCSARAGYEIAQGYRRSQKADTLTVSEKLAYIERRRGGKAHPS